MYPRTLYGFTEPKVEADAYRRELAWFKKYLPLGHAFAA
jgi:hypothetical protein